MKHNSSDRINNVAATAVAAEVAVTAAVMVTAETTIVKNKMFNDDSQIHHVSKYESE